MLKNWSGTISYEKEGYKYTLSGSESEGCTLHKYDPKYDQTQVFKFESMDQGEYTLIQILELF